MGRDRIRTSGVPYDTSLLPTHRELAKHDSWNKKSYEEYFNKVGSLNKAINDTDRCLIKPVNTSSTLIRLVVNTTLSLDN